MDPEETILTTKDIRVTILLILQDLVLLLHRFLMEVLDMDHNHLTRIHLTPDTQNALLALHFLQNAEAVQTILHRYLALVKALVQAALELLAKTGSLLLDLPKDLFHLEGPLMTESTLTTFPPKHIVALGLPRRVAVAIETADHLFR